MKTHDQKLRPSWIKLVHQKAKILYANIAEIQAKAMEAGLSEDQVDKACQPFYNLLDKLYEEELPIASAVDNSDLLVKLEGPALEMNTPSLSLISSTMGEIRLQVGKLTKIIADIQGAIKSSSIRIPKELDLGITALAKGSLYIGFSVQQPVVTIDGETIKSILGEEDPVYKATKEAIKNIGIVSKHVSLNHATKEISVDIPDSRIREASMVALQKIIPSGRRGIKSISLSGKQIEDVGVVSLTPACRESLSLLISPAKTTADLKTCEGIIREIDLDKRHFILRSDNVENDVLCYYKEDYDIDAKEWLDKKAKIQGTSTNKSSLKLENLDLL